MDKVKEIRNILCDFCSKSGCTGEFIICDEIANYADKISKLFEPPDDEELRQLLAVILLDYCTGEPTGFEGTIAITKIIKLYGDIRGQERERMLEEYQTLFQFAEKVAIAMDELKSSHAFFIIQQAFGDEDWDSSQDILDTVIAQSKALKGEKNDM